jgi:formylglycine-generating enzyme required for sulfatase activity
MWIPRICNRTYARIFGSIVLCIILQAQGASLSAANLSRKLSIGSGGARASSTPGLADFTQVGYAEVAVNSGVTPYGTAVFSFKQNGVTVTEAGVPASPPTTSARIFIDYRSDVDAVPGRSGAGIIDINTGIAIVNYGSAAANVTYTLRDANANLLSSGHGIIAAGTHFAKFIDQLKDEAPDFNLPPDFQNTIQFGSLEITSDQPLSVLALRGTNNQTNDFLITTTPIADLTQSPSYGPLYFPQFTDGDGYITSLVLLNTSSSTERGTLQILDDNGLPLIVNQVGGTADSSFRYYISPGGAFRFQTDGSPINLHRGWVQLIPDTSNPTPIGSGVFSYNPGGILLSESGIPAAVSTTHARVFVDLSGNHNTGLAIANVTTTDASITISAFQMDGVTAAGTSQGPLPLAANGHDAKFADQFISGLPAGFTGVLDISSTTPFAALTIRSLLNERHDFLMTTFPIADANVTAPSPIVFPQVADGGGYITQFILISTTGNSSVAMDIFGDNGNLLQVPISFTVMSGPYGLEFVTIPAGEFLMGTPDDAAHANVPDYDFTKERPVHLVAISEFFELGEFEVTQGQWMAVMGSNPSYFTGDNSFPVESVSWNDVQPFIATLNALNDGYQYRLPTEAEWEYACRAGTTGDHAGNIDEISWYGLNSGDHTHVVGTKKPNDWGLYDMHGNVLEWVQDWFDSAYYSISPSVDPPGPPLSSMTPPKRADRGGSYGNHYYGTSSSSRHYTDPDLRVQIIGFRLMRQPIN